MIYPDLGNLSSLSWSRQSQWSILISAIAVVYPDLGNLSVLSWSRQSQWSILIPAIAVVYPDLGNLSGLLYPDTVLLDSVVGWASLRIPVGLHRKFLWWTSSLHGSPRPMLPWHLSCTVQHRVITSRGAKPSRLHLNWNLLLTFFGSRHCTCVRRRGGNISVDLSSFVLLYNTNFMNTLKFRDFG